MSIPQVSQFFLPSRWSAGDQLPISQTGQFDPQTLVPLCHNQDLLMLMVERFLLADSALATWAEKAKECVDFAEGKQWSAQEIANALADDRPLITLNKLAPLLRLVIGYHR